MISPWASRWSLGGGAGVSDDYYFIEKFSRSGFELHFVAPRSDSPSELPFDNFYVHGYPDFFKATSRLPTALKRLVWPLLFNMIVTARTVQLARRIKPDFILGHSHYSSFPAFAAGQLLRIPTGVKLFGVMDLVHTEWPTWRYYSKNIEQILALKIPQDVWIILDDGTRGRDAALRHGVPDDRIRWLPNGINIEWMNVDYNGSRLRAAYDIPDDAVVVLFLARLVASKRPNMLLHAVPLIARLSTVRCVFVIAGDGPSRSGCEALARSLGVQTSVRFTGAIPHDRVPELMAAADIFVSTSNLTNAAIPTCEALVCGLPVVAFDVGDTRGLIHDGENGILVEDGDVTGLAGAIARLAGDGGLRLRMEEKAKQAAEKHLTGWDRRTDVEVEIIRRIIGERR
ncbi:MAG: glycosyltransferase family 4 protein [bacterium]